MEIEWAYKYRKITNIICIQLYNYIKRILHFRNTALFTVFQVKNLILNERDFEKIMNVESMWW